jgi:hypothetical protein
MNRTERRAMRRECLHRQFSVQRADGDLVYLACPDCGLKWTTYATRVLMDRARIQSGGGHAA